VSKTRYGRSGELRIAYELRGRMHRRPWLVLIQGMGLDRFGWEPVLRKLQRHFRLVLVDNRASGLSDRPAGVFAVADMAADIVAVLDAAGIRRAHVMGASLGGMVAQELAVDHPERVDGLVLACTTPGWPFAYPMPQASVRLIAATAGMSAGLASRRHAENALSARTVRHCPELVGRLVELQGSQPADLGALRAQAAAGVLYAGGRRHTRIRARTLVLQGAADTVVDPRNGQLLADRIPGARLVIFPELGHLLFWEDPDGFADAVTSFLLAGEQARKHPPAAVPGTARNTRPDTSSRRRSWPGQANHVRRWPARRAGRNPGNRHAGGTLTQRIRGHPPRVTSRKRWRHRSASR
jgi:3-oxoadipate enol-lactonase